METSKEYYDKVMSDYRSSGARLSRPERHRTSYRCRWRNAAEKSSETCKPQKPEEWRIQRTVLAGPYGEIEISGGSMPALLSLMANLRQEAE